MEQKYYYKQIIVLGNSPECFMVDHELFSKNLQEITEEEYFTWWQDTYKKSN